MLVLPVALVRLRRVLGEEIKRDLPATQRVSEDQARVTAILVVRAAARIATTAVTGDALAAWHCGRGD